MTKDTKGATIGLAPCPYCGQVWHKKSCPISVHASTSKGDGTATCTCPSGDASLRWPCPTHPNANYTSLRHYGSPNSVGEANALEAAGAGELQRRLSAISVAVTGRADSSEAEVMGCIDKLTDYFTDGVCSAAQSAPSSAPAASVAVHKTSAVGWTEAPRPAALSRASMDMLAERRRQVEKGYTAQTDDCYPDHATINDLARAAACYALAEGPEATGVVLDSMGRGIWPWDERHWKPKSRRRNLVKACALLLAELERMDRAAAKGAAGSEGGAA